ncbi:hypothetical protein WA158_006062 [Blastocystis sp. Blastoise]
MVVTESSWIALGLGLLAGLATAVGGAIVYFKSFVKLANQSFLSGALGFAAGVMLFISFSELYNEATTHFQTAGNSNQLSLTYTVLSFFVGMAISFILEKLLHKGTKVDFELPTKNTEEIASGVHKKKQKIQKHVPTYVDDQGERRLSLGDVVVNPVMIENGKKSISKEQMLPPPVPQESYEVDTVSGNTRDLSHTSYYMDNSTKSSLNNMGLMSAIAIAVHNIPEGIVSYVGYVDDPVVGFALALGIAAHNIPEGLSIALPIFYASGSRTKAFVWSLLAGLAEPVGSLLCMLVLSNFMSDELFGFLFGSIAGIMTYICVFELIPTGITLNCEKNYCVYGLVFGFFFIMISFILLANN